MRAVVLVGGQGTRLRPLTRDIPKQMLPVVEVPMIERVLSHLAGHGVSDAVLSLGYRHESFTSRFPDDRGGGLPLTYAVEREPLDTAGAIAFAARAAGIDDTFVVVNGDVLTDLDVSALVEHHRQRPAEATIALARVPDPSAFGLVRTEPDGRVVAFVEKPPAAEAGDGAVNAGTYVLEPETVDRVPVGGRMSVEREVFPRMAAEGRLYAFASDAYWTDTGTPGQYLQAHLDLLSGRRPGVPAPDARRGEGPHGPVWTQRDAVVDGDVRGPSLVGAAAFVEAGAEVEEAVVGARCRVSKGAVVRRAVLLPGAAVRSDAVVEESLVGRDAVIGEGAHVRNLSIVGCEATVPPGAVFDADRLPEDG